MFLMSMPKYAVFEFAEARGGWDDYKACFGEMNECLNYISKGRVGFTYQIVDLDSMAIERCYYKLPSMLQDITRYD